MTVREGHSKAVLRQHFDIVNPHFDTGDITIHVMSQPEHGYLESSRRPDVHLEEFSMRLVEVEFLYYVHDDSDSTEVRCDIHLRYWYGI